ncbi:ricin-type beta-trefoil lectin domain protein [Hamadaea tsunoensis]|uniref:ricin-type beta-trefoil lectin domain protein n=1 Tax=Hamadaea tsunoensis TaxID=53368 RepID=UPI00054F5A7C|nr:ricin-type beta-trefoil lectin domain protein [Hamadaea tsunoensis]
MRSGRHRSRLALAAVTAVLAATVGFTTPAAAAVTVGQITGYGGKCVDLSGGSAANGTAVQLWTCNGTSAQQWTVGNTDNSIRALGKCMDVTAAGTANGTKVQLYDCNATNAQKWTVSGGRLVNTGSGRCLDATGVSSADGTRLQIWDCGTGANQQWILPGGTQPPPTTTTFPFAPYIATFVGNNVAQFAANGGPKFYTLGFVNGTGNCQPIWSTDDNQLRGYVAQLRAAGGDVIVSSGGWDADDLVSHCSTASAIATAYQSVLTAYATTYLDIDAEHGDVHNNLDPAVVDKRNDALKILQNNLSAAGKTLHLSFTLGVSPAGGLSGENLYVLQSAVARGLTFDVVNPMTMDYYDGVSGSQMGQASINALKKVEGQLKTLLPGRTDAQLWAMIAATPMIGQNDDPSERFTLADAQLLLTFAQQQHMARLSFWAINRDFGCAAGTLSGTCSGISQANYAFSNIFRQFTG